MKVIKLVDGSRTVTEGAWILMRMLPSERVIMIADDAPPNMVQDGCIALLMEHRGLDREAAEALLEYAEANQPEGSSVIEFALAWSEPMP